MVNSQLFLTVRGYELDSLGHVNNAVYLNYLEHARWKMLYESGYWDYFLDRHLFLVVVETKIRYQSEARMFDQLTVKTTIARHNPYVVFYQNIFNQKTQKRLIKAEIKTILVDDQRLPHDFPASFIEGDKMPDAEKNCPDRSES